MHVNVSSTDESKKLLQKGIDLVANAVASTLGPRGRNFVSINLNNEVVISKDGVSCARAIESVEDPFINLGVQLCKKVSSKTNDVAGDGPQPLYSKVLTPNGFVEMGSLKVGDKICGTNGSIQEVVGIYPKGKKEIYNIKLFDGTEVKCCEDHLWSLYTYYNNYCTLTTKQMFQEGVLNEKDGYRQHKYYIPVHKAEFFKTNLPLDPYLLGLLLGDGSLSGTGSVELSLGPKDGYILDEIILPDGFSFNATYNEAKHYFRVKIKGKNAEGKTMKAILDDLGLLGTKSDTKFIPKNYLYSDSESRSKLLQGLIDTDGYINKRGRIEYSTTSINLATDVRDLMKSLGIISRIKCYKRTGSSYSDTCIFRVTEMKGFRNGLSVEDIIPTGEYTEMQCIKVSNDDHLYFTDGYNVTHNTTTATVLAQAIVNEGLKYVNAGGNALALKRGIDKALDSAILLIESNSKEVSSKEEIEFVASISGNDSEVGSIVAEAIEKVGKDGIITLEESGQRDTIFQIVDGYTYNQGYISPLFITNTGSSTAEYEDVVILMFDNEIPDFMPFVPIIEKASKLKKPIVIIAPSFGAEMVRGLALNKVRGGHRWLATKTPGFGDQKKEYIQDICAMVGGKVFNDAWNKYEEFDESFYGYAKRIVCTKDYTTIIDGKKNPELLKQRSELIKNLYDAEESQYNKEKLNERLAKLNEGVAIIKVGASTETELKEKKDRYEDALNATRAAIEEGIVPGGGSVLLRISEVIEKNTQVDEQDADEIHGVRVLANAMKAPFKQICKNGGFSADVKAYEVLQQDFPYGFDAKYGEICDLLEKGVIDPAKVTKSALINAVSIASLVLTTETLIAPQLDNSEKFIMADPNMY